MSAPIIIDIEDLPAFEASLAGTSFNIEADRQLGERRVLLIRLHGSKELQTQLQALFAADVTLEERAFVEAAW